MNTELCSLCNQKGHSYFKCPESYSNRARNVKYPNSVQELSAEPTDIQTEGCAAEVVSAQILEKQQSMIIRYAEDQALLNNEQEEEETTSTSSSDTTASSSSTSSSPEFDITEEDFLALPDPRPERTGGTEAATAIKPASAVTQVTSTPLRMAAVLSGDFNTITDIRDRIPMKDVELTREGQLLKLVCETCNMKDAFREKFPDDLGFTCISNTVKTGIDRIYVNSSLETKVISYKTEYLMESDHLGVNVKVNLGVVEDRGYWKLNTQCLKQRNMSLELAKEIERIKSLKLAVRNDEELNKLLGGVTIAQGGVLPNIQAVLLPKKTEKPAKTK
ncbi:hypothetical protein SRHO_G00243150 [Serrasalmus rhombeus]